GIRDKLVTGVQTWLFRSPRKSVYRAVADIDRDALAEFQAGIRKRYTDEQILAELKQSSERLGRSPTMREFAADAKTTVHPQTVRSEERRVGKEGRWRWAP